MKMIATVAAAAPLFAGIPPAAAQSDLGAVTCVGSELETIPSTSPVRPVVQTDQEVVYRVRVDPANREAVEGSLRSQLDSYAEVWCAWSDVGDSHLMIIEYTGVIRRDLTIDLEDPRFQAFGVGYGRSREEAEQFATTLDDPLRVLQRRRRIRGAGPGDVERGRRRCRGRQAGRSARDRSARPRRPSIARFSGAGRALDAGHGLS